MFSRNELLEIVNELNRRYAGSKVGFVNGYRDQWFLGGCVDEDGFGKQRLELHFCQGRNVGRIKSDGGFTVILDVSTCETREGVFEEFDLLDHHKRYEKEKAGARRARLEARCPRCVNYIGKITGNCSPSQSCGYKRIRKRKGGIKKMEEHMVEAMFGPEPETKELCF